jgi:hypothetical protein
MCIFASNSFTTMYKHNDHLYTKINRFPKLVKNVIYFKLTRYLKNVTESLNVTA